MNNIFLIGLVIIFTFRNIKRWQNYIYLNECLCIVLWYITLSIMTTTTTTWEREDCASKHGGRLVFKVSDFFFLFIIVIFPVVLIHLDDCWFSIDKSNIISLMSFINWQWVLYLYRVVILGLWRNKRNL